MGVVAVRLVKVAGVTWNYDGNTEVPRLEVRNELEENIRSRSAAGTYKQHTHLPAIISRPRQCKRGETRDDANLEALGSWFETGEQS